MPASEAIGFKVGKTHPPTKLVVFHESSIFFFSLDLIDMGAGHLCAGGSSVLERGGQEIHKLKSLGCNLHIQQHTVIIMLKNIFFIFFI